MRPITAFFDKFRNLEPPERALRNAVRRAVREQTGIDLEDACIRIVRTAAVIDAPSVIKSEIKLSEQVIVARVCELLANSKRRIDEIR